SLRGQLAQIAQTPLGVDVQKLPIERYQAFVMAALILLAESWLLPLRVRLPSLRARRVRPEAGIAAVLLLAVLIAGCGGEDDGLSFTRANAAANALYDAGQYQEALDAYQKLIAKRPDIPELSVNAGNALHRLQQYDNAAQETLRALPPNDP